MKILKPMLDIAVQNVTGIITRVTTKEPFVSLTFDDGPDPIYTPKVLDVLREYDAHATFFMVGEGAHSHPDIVKRVAKEGHAIGNHSWNHFAFPLISFAEQWDQIKKCQQVLKPYGRRLFRPPYGLNNNRSNIGVFLLGYKAIGWSLSSEDWSEASSEAMGNRLVKNIKPGSIILLHDRIFDEGKPKNGPTLDKAVQIDREPMLSTLRWLLKKLKGDIQFVTIPVLLSNGQPLREREQSVAIL